MKFDCPRKEFFEAVSAAAAAASSRTSVNVLQNLKIEANDGGIRVLGCDGEMWVERDVACMVSEAGAICVPAKFLNDLVSSLPDGDVQVRTLDGNAVLLQQGASEYRMVSLDPTDFPEPPSFGAPNAPTAAQRRTAAPAARHRTKYAMSSLSAGSVGVHHHPKRSSRHGSPCMW